MENVILPNVLQFNSAVSFFTEFYRQNSEEFNESYQSLAGKVEWPASYLNELIHHKKRFTLQRALEFSEFAQHSLIEKRYTVYLALADNASEKVANHFQNTLVSKVSSSPWPDDQEQLEIFDLWYPNCVFLSLAHSNGEKDLDLVRRLVPEPDLDDSAITEESFELLLEKGFIRQAGEDRYELTGKSMFADITDYPKLMAYLQKSYPNIFLKYFRERELAYQGQAELRLSNSEMMQFREKLNAIKRHITTIIDRFGGYPEKSHSDKSVYFYSFNFLIPHEGHPDLEDQRPKNRDRQE